MTIRIVAQGTVLPENMEKFRAFTQEAVANVRDKEAGKTTVYEFFVSNEGRKCNCLIHEVYVDADAFVAHLQNLGDRMAEIQAIFETEWILLTGPVPDVVAEQFRQMGNVRFYEETLEAL